MSEAQEFGGPINRPANNARQVTPGEALTNAQPSGAGVDFLGLNQQMQGEVAPRAPAPAPAPAQERSWLMEVTDSAPSSLAPAAQELAPSPTAASLLNASWREETPQPRRSRWLVPVAGGAVLCALGVIGLPYLRRESAPEPVSSTTVAPRPTPAVNNGPAAPSATDEATLAGLEAEPRLEPVAPDAKLDRPERPRAGRAGAPLAQVSGRSEAPVNAPDPGSSFVAPSDVIDPSGVWTISPGDGDAAHGAEGDVDTGEPLDGAPHGVTSSAVEREESEAHVVAVGECSTPAPRRAALPESVEVDWDRLVWIARTGEPHATPEAGDSSSAAASDALDSAAEEPARERGIARALDAWSAAELSESEASAEEAPSVTIGDPAAGLELEQAQPLEVAAVTQPTTQGAAAAPVAWIDEPSETTSAADVAGEEGVSELEAEALKPADEVLVATAGEAGGLPASPESVGDESELDVRVEILPAPVDELESAPQPENSTQPEAVPQPEAAPQPENATQPEAASAAPTSAEPARVRVLSRSTGRGGERRLAAERRRARRQQELTELGSQADELEIAALESAPAQPAPALESSQPPVLDPRVQVAEEVVADPLVAPREPTNSHDAAAAQEPTPVQVAPSPTVAEAEPTPLETSDAQPLETPQAQPAPSADLQAPSPTPAPLAPVEPSATPAPGAAPESTPPAPRASNSNSSSVPAPSTKPSEPEPQRVLQVASAADLEHVWAGETIPLEAVSGAATLATPHIGPTRVVFHTGEVFEGELVAVGEGRLWLRNSVGRIALDGARVKSAQRIAPGASLSVQAAQAKQLAGLPRARVKTPGGVLHGRVLERNERVTTLIMNSGARIVLDSRSVEVLADVPLVQIRQ